MQYDAGVPVYKRINNKKSKITKYRLTIAKIILIALCGFMLSRVSISLVEGLTISPFGIAFLISIITKKNNKELLIGFLGVIVGYISIFANSMDTYIYLILATSILIMSYIYEKTKKKIKNKHIYAVLILEYLLLGSLFGSQGLSVNLAFSLIKALCFIPVFHVINYGISCIDEINHNYFFSIEELISIAIIICLMVAGTGTIAAFGVSVRNIAAISIIIIIAYAGGASVGAVIGVTMGMIVGVTSKNILLFISLYSCCGLVVGVFKETGKLFSALSYLIVSSIIVSYSTRINLYGAVEIFIPALIMLAVPAKFVQKILREISNEEKSRIINEAQIEGVKLEFVERVEGLKKVLDRVAKSMNKLSSNNKLTLKDKGTAMVDNLADRVCNDCENKNKCWKKDLNKTYFEFSDLIQSFEEGHGKLNSNLREKCVKSNTLLKNCEEMCSINNVNETLRERIGQGRKLVAQQIGNISDAMNDVIKEFKRDVDNCYELDKVLKKALSRKDIHYKDIYSFTDKKGRLKIKLTMENCYGNNICGKTVVPVLKEVLRVPLSISDGGCKINPETNECSVEIEESPKYHMLSYVASTPKEGEKYSGDSFSFRKNKNGTYVIALSDGMGSGPEAGLESSVAIDIIDDFVESGYDEEAAIKIVNSIMNMKFSEDEKYATLDLEVVDLYSGEMTVVKAGGVSTFIKRYEEIDVISDNTLPFGTVEELEYSKKKKKLKHGDIIITISDGVLDVDKNNIGDYSWLRTYLEKATTNPEQLSRDILEKAKELSGGRVLDDMTVVVSKLYSVY